MMYLTGVVVLVFSLVGDGTAQLENEINPAGLMISPNTEYRQKPSPSEDYERNVLFYLYTKSTVDTPQQLLINNVSSLIHSDFDTSRKTLMVIHGYRNTLNSPSFQDIKNGSLRAHDFNVIGVDWDYFTRNLNYGWVVSNTKPVGVYISEFIEFLMANGLSKSELHLIGHSIGAHAAGFAGKQLRDNGHTVARISGLDPALPGFYNIQDATARLNATDAEYVDCIHTCGGILGIPSPICQADFFPNRGENVQPGCSYFDLGICSHGRSFKYYAESFDRTHLFRAETCKEVSFWVPSDCHDEGVLMGYPAGTKKYKGLFSLTTNREYPFAKNITAT